MKRLEYARLLEPPHRDESGLRVLTISNVTAFAVGTTVCMFAILYRDPYVRIIYLLVCFIATPVQLVVLGLTLAMFSHRKGLVALAAATVGILSVAWVLAFALI